MPRNEALLDRIASIPPGLAGRAAFVAIDRLQDLPVEARIAGSALLFLMLVRQAGVHPGNALEVANNLIDQAIAKTPELRAAKQWVRDENKT
jgi:hypothetical protein